MHMPDAYYADCSYLGTGRITLFELNILYLGVVTYHDIACRQEVADYKKEAVS